MRAFLDDKAFTVPGQGSIAEAIAAARVTAQSSGRVIVDVLIDGERLDEEALESPSDKPAGDIEFKCISADPRRLVAESFRDVAGVLTQARTTQREAAGSLQTGKLETAFDQLAQALEVWDAVHRVTEQGPALLGVNLSSLAGSGVSIDDQLARLSASLQQLKDSVAAQDWSTLSDLLEHELDEAAALWADLLTGFAARADSTIDGGGVNA